MAYKRCLITNNNPVQLLDKSKYPATQTVNGVTFTNNGDGTITANGTSSAEAPFTLGIPNIKKGHKYFFYGLTENGGWHKFVIFINTVTVITTTSGEIFTASKDSNINQMHIYINSKNTVSNLTFKPQLFDLTEMFGAGNEPSTVAEFRALYPNDLYPYNPTNYLTSYKKMMKVSDVCQLLDKSKYFETTTKNGITFTNNGDGTITVNGTATTTTYLSITVGINISLNTSHRYLTSGCPTGGSYSSFFLYLDNGGNIAPLDFGNGSIGRPIKDKASVTICIYSNITFSNAVFKPQLFDLTEMYGAGNEPTTVAAFREKFPNEMYPYSPQCFVTAYKNNMVAKTKNLWTCDKPAPNYQYQYDSSTQVFKIKNICSLSCYTLPTPFPTGTTVSISVHFLSGVIKEGGTVSIGGYHNVGTKSWQCNINLPYTDYRGIDLTGRTFTSTYTTTDTLTDFWIFIYGSVPENMQFKVQFELGSTVTDYVPYGYL